MNPTTAQNQRVEVNRGDYAHTGRQQRKRWEHWKKRRDEWALHGRLNAAQFEQAQYAPDIHQDGSKLRHGDDVGGQRLPANFDEFVAVDRRNTNHPARQSGAVWCFRSAGAAH